MANSDAFRINIGGSNDDGYVELATAAGGNEPIYIRQYVNNDYNQFYSLIHEACLLDANGNTNFPGIVTAPTFDGVATYSTKLNGTFTTPNKTWNTMGDDVAIGDFDCAGCVAIKGLDYKTGLAFVSHTDDTDIGYIVYENKSLQTTKPFIINGLATASNIENRGTSESLPELLFHIPGVNSTRLQMSTDGTIHVKDGETNTLKNIEANTFYGSLSSSVKADNIAALVGGSMGNNDCFRICIGGAEDAGWVEIATADNGTEPIYVRQYNIDDNNNSFGSITRQAALLDGGGNTSFPGNVSAGGHFVGTISTNDYAELFPRLLINNKEKTYVSTNPGDLIALDLSNNEGNNKECYTLANDKSKIIVGVQSDEYAMIIGGKYTDETDNLKEFIPVSLAGRVFSRVLGKVNIGDYIIPSNIDGCDKAASKNDDLSKSVGIVVSLLDSDNTTKTEHFVKILVK